ncbi:MAG: acylphosphatase [Pseudodesulfovibrio sp.]
MKSYTCIVEGKVAGTNFQSWVQGLAQQLGLTGWVRNIADRKAEVLVQGEAEAYAAFREKLRTEAPVLDLADITCSAIQYDTKHETFSIRG